MKRILSYLLIFFSVIAIASCAEEDKTVTGTVTKRTETTVDVQLADSTMMTFNIEKAEFTNGVTIPGDNVVVTYNGKKAKTIYVRSTGRVVDGKFDPERPLITR